MAASLTYPLMAEPPRGELKGLQEPKAKPKFEFVALSALLISLVALSIDSMLPALEAIGGELDAGGGNQAQLVVSALFLGLGVGQAIYGPLSDRFGRKPLIQAGLALFALGCMLSIFATSFPMMLMGRVLQGLGVAGPRIVTVAMVRDRYKGAAMAEIMSLIMTLFILVPTVAPAIGQGLLLIGSWRLIFVVLLVFALFSFLWLTARQPETLAHQDRRPLSIPALAAGARETCRNPVSRGYMLASGLLLGAFLGYLNSTAQIFQSQYGLGSLFPLYFAITALSLGSASLLNARMVMRLGMGFLTRLAMRGVVAISFLFLPMAWMFAGHPPFWALLLFLLIVFFCVGLLFGNLNAIAMEPLGHIAGIAASVIGTVTTLLAMILGGLIGWAYDGTVLPMIFGFALLSGLSLLTMSLADRRIAKRPV